jgi:anti-sigma-K factor RskA
MLIPGLRGFDGFGRRDFTRVLIPPTSSGSALHLRLTFASDFVTQTDNRESAFRRADSRKVEQTATAVLPLANAGSKRRHRGFHPDLVAVLETVGDGFHRAVNANWHSTDLLG